MIRGFKNYIYQMIPPPSFFQRFKIHIRWRISGTPNPPGFSLNSTLSTAPHLTPLPPALSEPNRSAQGWNEISLTRTNLLPNSSFLLRSGAFKKNKTFLYFSFLFFWLFFSFFYHCFFLRVDQREDDKLKRWEKKRQEKKEEKPQGSYFKSDYCKMTN